MSQKKVLIPLAQGCEELEAVTLIDLLVRAEIDVVTASLDNNRTITASRGVQLIAQTALESVLQTPFDLVVLPGGLPGADHLNKDIRLHQFLKEVVISGGYIGAICAAPKVLVSAGLLEGKQATSFPGVIDQHPAEGMTFLDQPVVVDGQIITSRGPGTAIAFTLTLIEMLVGASKRAEVQASLQI